MNTAANLIGKQYGKEDYFQYNKENQLYDFSFVKGLCSMIVIHKNTSDTPIE